MLNPGVVVREYYISAKGSLIATFVCRELTQQTVCSTQSVQHKERGCNHRPSNGPAVPLMRFQDLTELPTHSNPLLGSVQVIEPH